MGAGCRAEFKARSHDQKMNAFQAKLFYCSSCKKDVVSDVTAKVVDLREGRYAEVVVIVSCAECKKEITTISACPSLDLVAA